MSAADAGADDPVAATRAWLEHAVIGLGLCPFASGVLGRCQVRFAVSGATGWPALRADLDRELTLLAGADALLVDTTLIVCPSLPGGFDDFNEFLDEADEAVREQGLEGVIQVASFHPRFRFAGTDDDDVTNATNQAPWPTLHLLREDSVERALAGFPNPETIYEANLRTLEALGAKGWQRLSAKWLKR